MDGFDPRRTNTTAVQQRWYDTEYLKFGFPWTDVGN